MKYLNYLGLLTLSLFIISCSGGGSSNDIARSSSGTTTVTLNVSQQNSSAQSAPFTVPAAVTSMDCRVSGSGMSVINAPIDISSDTAVIDVSSGPARTFKISAYDAGGALIFFGETTVDLFGASANLSITMNPVSSNGLQGTWNLHSIISGDLAFGEWPGWEHGQGTINSGGTLVFNEFLCSDLTAILPGNLTINVAPDNKVIIPEEPTFGGLINTANDLIFGTLDHEDGGYELVLAQKAGSGFALPDLAGNWKGHGISTGDGPGLARWGYADAAIDAVGNVSFTNIVNSFGPQGDQNATFALSPDGIITIPAAPLAHGAINIGKDLIVWTDSDTGSTNLFIGLRSGGTFAQNDLAGTWIFHGVISGDDPQDREWERGTANIDALGNVTVTSFLDSDGSTTNFTNTTFTIAADGIVTISGGGPFHGKMNAGKDLVVGTTDDDDGGYKLVIMYKESNTFFSGPAQLTFDAGNDYYPVWDPASDTIAFLTNRAPSDGSNLNIGMIQADGTGEGNMATGANTPLALGWSLSWVGSTGLLMTNERIVFHEYLAFDTSATLPFNRVVSDGNDAAFTRKLQTPGGSGGDLVRVSRDGSTALWQHRNGGAGPWILYSAPYASLSGQNTNAVGGSTVQWNSAVDLIWPSRGVAITPDGSQFIIPLTSGSGTDLFIGNLVYTQLTTSGSVSGEINDHPDVSPDGNWVAFRNNGDLWKINVDGTGLTQLTNDALSQGWPSWSPDGTRLAYHQYDTDNYNIWVMDDPSGGGPPPTPGIWTHPADLTDYISPDGGNAIEPQVAMDNNGNAIIVWLQSDGADDQIFMSEYRSGVWSHPANLADNISPDGQNAGDVASVAMDNNGNAIIVWYQWDGSNEQIFKSEYRSGVWTHPANLADNISPNGQNAIYPQVAMDNNGNAIITWRQSDGSNGQIFKSEYRSGSWTHPTGPSDNISPNGQTAQPAQVAMDDNGNAIIVWRQSDSADEQIFMSEYRSGSWAHPILLSDNISPDGQPAVDPQVAMDNNSNAIIAWEQWDGSDEQIFKSEYRSGVWTHPANLADNISPAGQDAFDPQIAMDNNGNAIIAWSQLNASFYQQIFKSEYRSSSWTHPADLADYISPGVTDDAYRSVVTMDNNGNAIISWGQFDGSNQQIFKSEYRSGVWSHPANLADNISPDGQDTGEISAVAMDNNGNAIIVWLQNDGVFGDSIFKSEYR